MEGTKIFYLVFLSAVVVTLFKQGQRLAGVFLFLSAACLISLSLNSLMYLRGLDKGAEFCLTTFYLTNISDTAAFIAGGLWGKNKLYYEISPGKTIASAASAILFTMLCGYLFNYLLELGLAGWQSLLLAAAISLSGQVGDLLASVAKRSAKIKDFSQRLPGHGGLLDRRIA